MIAKPNSVFGTLIVLALSGQKALAATCKIASSNGAADDTPAVKAALTTCASSSTIVFEEGVDYNLFNPIEATLNNVEIKLKGNIHLPQNITYVQGIVNASGGGLEWINLKGTNLTFSGTKNVSTGWIYSYGQAWYDANPVNGTGLVARPSLISFDVTGGVIKDFKASQPIAAVWSLSGENIHVKNVLIDATSNGSFPFNTDGFDIGATNVLIEDAIVLNGDDAFTIKNDGHNVTVRNALIGGPGCHGCSIGSLEDNANVTDILFTDITVVGCLYAARFKSYAGGNGLTKNVTWQNFLIHNVTFPIYVTQTYYNQGDGSSAPPTNSNSSVIMEDFTYSNFKGTINTYNPGDWSCVTDPCWYAVPGADGTQSVVIDCDTSDSCSNFQLSEIEVVPMSGVSPTSLCTNLDIASNPNLGFVCQNGTFIQT